MASSDRIISGSLAAWVRIGIGVGAQIITVPIFLKYWGVEIYGLWLIIQTIFSLITISDVAHQNFLGYEFLKLGKDKRSELASIFCSALPVAFFISLTIFAGLYFLIYSGILYRWVELQANMREDFEVSLLVTAMTWVITGSMGGIIGRILYLFDLYPLISWCVSLWTMLSAAIPIVAISFGANIVGTSIAISIANIIYNIILMSILLPRIRKEQLFSGKILLYQGFLRYLISLTLAFQNGLDLFRQQGIRIVLTLVTDISQMTTFSTMRTGANFALQGLNSVTCPIMPELMRFLVARDQHKTEGTFAIVWLVLCAVLSPFVLVIQYFAPVLFPLWTHGKIIYDPWLLSVLSLDVLIYALAQPAIAVIQGNNLIRPQLLIALIAAIITIGGLFLLVPLIGIIGAALALLLAEVIILFAYLLIVAQWLSKNIMYWPWPTFFTALTSVLVAAIGMAVLAKFPNFGLECLSAALLVNTLVIIAYWRRLPPLVHHRAASLIGRLMPVFFRKRLLLIISGSQID